MKHDPVAAALQNRYNGRRADLAAEASSEPVANAVVLTPPPAVDTPPATSDDEEPAP